MVRERPAHVGIPPIRGPHGEVNLDALDADAVGIRELPADHVELAVGHCRLEIVDVGAVSGEVRRQMQLSPGRLEASLVLVLGLRPDGVPGREAVEVMGS